MKTPGILPSSAGERRYNTRTYDLEEGMMRCKVAIDWLLRINVRPSMIQIAGGSASGKTSIVTKMLEDHYREKTIRISMDDYYFGKTYMMAEAKKGRKLNWDQPEAIDISRLYDHIMLLREGRPIRKPIYSMIESEPIAEEEILPAETALIEGLFMLTPGLHELGDLNIFTQADDETRLKRRIIRDEVRTGQSKDEIIRCFWESVEPMHKKYIESTSKNAHLIIRNNLREGEI